MAKLRVTVKLTVRKTCIKLATAHTEFQEETIEVILVVETGIDGAVRGGMNNHVTAVIRRNRHARPSRLRISLNTLASWGNADSAGFA